MPTPVGIISASDIAKEFGYSRANNSVSLGAYRISQTVSDLPPLPLDTDIQNSVAVGNSAINFGSFRGKKLNVVVNCTPPSGQWRSKVNAREDYNNNTNITVIGGFKTRPSSPANTKVIIHNNGNIGSYVYLSRGYVNMPCTYDVIVGYTDCYIATDYDETSFEVCPTPVYESQTNFYGGLHFYASPSEVISAGYTLESKYYIRMFPSQEPGTTPLYRLYRNTTKDHLYTIDENEWKTGGNGQGYNQEGPVGYVYGYAAPSTNPVYRGYKVYGPPGGDCPTLIDRLYTFEQPKVPPNDDNELNRNGFTVDNDGNPVFYAPAFVSDAYSRTSCALFTGSWDTSTELIVDIGASARIYGSGGDGGNGGDNGSSGGNGGDGTSAIGVNATSNTIINVRSGAIISGGGGGGGGGGYARADSTTKSKKHFTAYAGGGGGGGGAGYPAGTKGSKGSNFPGDVTGKGNQNVHGDGAAGGDGSSTAGGGGSSGGHSQLGAGTQASGGAGGGGGTNGKGGAKGYVDTSGDADSNSTSPGGDGSSTKGGNGSGGWAYGNSTSSGSGGTGGTNGYGIIVNVPSTSVTIRNNGSVSSIDYSITPS
jgi:hypothetical protein